MAVLNSDFTASLFQNLNLEHPCLPATSWDSIPSESGPRVSHCNSFTSRSSSTSHRPRHDTSVSEASMVRLAMNALQGVQSAIISIEKLSTAFCSDPADRTYHQIPSLWNRSSSTHAQGKILKSIGCSGFLVLLLRKFVDHFTNYGDNFSGTRQHDNPELADIQDRHGSKVQQDVHPPYSLVNHAFSVAVGKILEGYMCALDTLYASVCLRDSSESGEMPLVAPSGIGCLTTVVYSKITLLELYLHTKELRVQIEALGNICNLCPIAFCFSNSCSEDLIAKAMLEFCRFFRGGDLLTYLYAQLQVADPPHHAVLKFLFVRSFEPYCSFIRSWIYKAEISDPYKEFVVECIDNQPSQRQYDTDFPLATIRERDGVTIPCFLKDHLIPLVRAGQQLQVLMKLLELCTYVGSINHSYEDLLPCWDAFSSIHSSNACPITFIKETIETTVYARGCYYKGMLEKLECLLTKLEFRYQQVVSHGTVPKGFGDGGTSSNAPISFMLDKRLMVPSAKDKRVLNVDRDDVDSEDSSTVDDSSYIANTYESSSVCSSSNDEEKIDQLKDLSSQSFELEEKYLSGLSFSITSPFNNYEEKSCECEESLHIESDADGLCERDVLHGKLLDQISVAKESQEQNWACRSVNKYLERLPNNDWLGHLKSSVSVEGSSGGDSRSNLEDCDPRMSTKGTIEDGISYCRKLMVTSDSFSEELFSKDGQENSINNSALVTKKDWKVNSHNNFLSINPMLRKSSFLKLQTDPGEGDGTRYGKALPFFDFSSVEDSCNRCLENLSARLLDPGASAASNKIDLHVENCKRDMLLVEPKISYDNSLLEVKDYNQEDTASALVSGGSSWEMLLGRSCNTVNNGVRDHIKSSLAKFDIPLDFIIDKCLLQEIMLQYKYVSKLTIKLLEEGFDFKEHLLALRRYHFMEFADWADLFIMSLWHHKWCITEAEQRLAEIQGLLELSIQRSSCQFDHNKDRLYVFIKGHDTMPLSASAIGLHSFDFLGLGYRVDWPVSIVLTPEALKIYSEIFSFLIKVKIGIFSLSDIWRSLKELRPLISVNQQAELSKQEVGHFNLLMKMRHQVSHFVSTLQQYVESQLSHVSWCRFMHSLQHKVKDMMDLESVHMAYLIDSLHVCFLSDETRHIARIIDSILQCALDFRSCLRGGMWDVGLNQGELVGKLSRVNISQVLAMKKVFDKNIQELHLYYLKSPKHGEYGLSRFWGHLNFNEYYSDNGNEMRFYAAAI
ncbi:hypothetical protein CsatB_028541 [Cannabis sativa]